MRRAQSPNRCSETEMGPAWQEVDVQKFARSFVQTKNFVHK